MAPEPPTPHDRRGFFRESAARLVGPLADFLAGRLPDAGELPSTAGPAPPVWLRPPGALDEALFLETCKRCGDCAAACPADAIRALREPGSATHGTPVIDADAAACVVCDGLKCTHVCPSGALIPLGLAAEIRMGLAVVDSEQCVRSRGESCTRCVELCPLGAGAITFGGDGPPSVHAGCVGCGVCQLACPTRPRAIRVQPAQAVGEPRSSG